MQFHCQPIISGTLMTCWKRPGSTLIFSECKWHIFETGKFKFAFMKFPLLDMCLVAPVLTGHPWERDQWTLSNTNIILKVGFSIQGSYRFLDPKFNTFSRIFSWTIDFFQTQGYRIGNQYRPWKTQEESFLHGALQIYSQDWIRFYQK